MSIKSDRWIRRLCSPPTFVVTEMVKGLHAHGGFAMVEKERFTWETPEELRRRAHQSTLSPHQRSSTASFQKPIELQEYVLGYHVPTAKELEAWASMIEPFEPGQVRQRKLASLWTYPDGPNMPGEEEERFEKVISYGTSSFGYDVRCADEFKVFTNINSVMVDPKNFDEKCFVDVSGKGYCIIPPNSFALARTVERFKIPRDVLVVCLGKSTYARCGVVVNVTPLEPEWEGYVTLEFSNTTPLPAKIYANEGCAQMLFLQGDEDCEVSYLDRRGKYQNQAGVTLPKS